MSPTSIEYVCSGREQPGDKILLVEVDGIVERKGTALERVIVGSGKATVQLLVNQKHRLGDCYRIKVELVPRR